MNSLLPLDIIEEYTIYHDCGKVFCLQYDADGKRHFPDHAQMSYHTWLRVGGNMQAAKLMQMDMIVHTIKTEEIDQFIAYPEAITLLIVALAEIHSNAQMFGGLESVSFKIKWKKIDKRGKMICQKIFRRTHVVE